jgi:hypothetical protein
MAANTQSAEAFDDYAFKLDHNIRDNRVEPDTIADPEGAKSRAVAASHAQLPPFVTEDFTPRYNEATARWSLTPKQTSIAALESEAREIYEYQITRSEIQERADKLALAMETVLSGVGQWTALDFARNHAQWSSLPVQRCPHVGLGLQLGHAPGGEPQRHVGCGRLDGVGHHSGRGLRRPDGCGTRCSH